MHASVQNLILISILGLVASAHSQTCHESVGPTARGFMSSKRPYHFHLEDEEGNHTPPGCTAVKLWYFGRHGTRYPGDEDIEAMLNILPKLHQEILEHKEGSFLCPDVLEYFSSWQPRPDLNVSQESYLHEQGKYELNSISSRFVSKFPHLFPGQFDNDTYYFRFTDAQRTRASAEAFASSIFGVENLGTVWFPEPHKNDPVLKFYSACEKWKEEVDDNPEANKEHDKFVVSEVMNKTVANVSRRLGLARNLTLEELTIVYTTCAFETAWNNETLSPWCGVFDVNDFQVMAYREDLEYFWKDGFGFNINFEQACVPFKDAVQFFDEYSPNTIKNDTYRKVQAYFSHSGATLKMLARLGMFNGSSPGGSGDVIRSDNFENTKDSYLWRTSWIDFMATNMAFVMYTCGDEGSNQIGFFLQEVATPFPACGNKAFCKYEEFRENLEVFTGHCELKEICKV